MKKYKIEEVKGEKLEMGKAQLIYRADVDFGDTIQINLSGQKLRIYIEPDYEDNPSIYIHLGK